ncbi:DNA methylase N-4 [Clostridia bacterium]|nr:DNA methylase N-4 [Clostridia bacterium]
MDNESVDNEKLDRLSMDVTAAQKEKLRAVFPEVFTEGKLDIDALLNLCGEYITDDFEKYEFKWKGKSECVQIAGKRSAATLRPCREESVDFDTTQNVYIEGDNLEVLKLLQIAYFGRVKMIYIDPPYNTGNDFVYADDFADPLARYREVTQQTTKSNPESMGRFHTNWLNMMWPRLRLAANLLRNDGVIFVSIDDTEVHNLRKLMDDCFGEENFVASVVWKRKRGRDNSARWFSKAHEYLLIYAKRIDDFDTNFLELDEETKSAYKNPDNDPRGDWRMLGCWARGTQGGVFYDFTTKDGQHFSKRLWLFSKKNLQALDEEDKLVIRGDNIYRKMFITENKGKIPDTLWDNVSNAANASDEIKKIFDDIIFDTPKPVPYIMHMLKIATNSNDIIFDFFSGSATTAHAVMQLNAEDGKNRRFMCIQLPELCGEKSEAYRAGYKNICEIGKERIRRAGAKIKSETTQVKLGEETKELDIGFRVFKLDSSNLKLWDDSPIVGENALAILEERIRGMLDILKPDRTDEDIVYETMLKLGQDLCSPVLPIDIGDGRLVYGVGEDVTFIVCIAKRITAVEARIMAEYAPGRIVFADQCFENSTDKSNVKLVLRNVGVTLRVL